MRITEVKVQAYSYPVSPAWGSIDQRQLAEITLVTVSTDEGIEGYSMGQVQGPATVLAQEVVSVARPRILGEDALDREKIWQQLWELGRRTRLSIRAISCIDVALWDIAGKAFNTPVYKLLGAYRDKVPAYASSPIHSSTERFVEEALDCKSRGYQAYKLHPPRIPEKDVEISRAVRLAVGDGMKLMLDPAGYYDHRQAMWVGRRLEELNFYWYEEPIADYDISGYAELCRALDISVLVGEVQSANLYSAVEFLSRGAADELLADVFMQGGITPLMKIAHLCEAFGTKLAVHHGASGIGNWANLHCLGALKNSDFLEILVPEGPHNYGLGSYARIDADGFVTLPQKPGLGVEIDWSYINAHTTFQVDA